MRNLAFFVTTVLASSLAQAVVVSPVAVWNTVPFTPFSASADGSVVVGDDITVDDAWRWTVGTAAVALPRSVSSLNIGAGTVLVSGDGNLVAAAHLDSSTGLRSAGTYNASTGQWTILPGLGGYSATVSTPDVNASKFTAVNTVYGMSSNGNYAVGQGYLAGNGTANARGVVWNLQTNTAIALGANPGVSGPNARTKAVGISNDGTVVAGVGGGSTPLVWKSDGNGGYTTIQVSGAKTLPGVTGTGVTQVNGLSANGLWAVGQGGNGNNSGAAYRYNTATNTIYYLPQVNPLQGTDAAMATTADGSMIVGYEGVTGTAQARSGFIWLADGTDAGHSMSLDSFLAGYGIDTSDTFNFATPMSISSNGLTTTITGFGFANDSQVGEGFSVTIPYATAVPEASTYAMMLAGLGAMGFVVRRRRDEKTA